MSRQDSADFRGHLKPKATNQRFSTSSSSRVSVNMVISPISFPVSYLKLPLESYCDLVWKSQLPQLKDAFGMKASAIIYSYCSLGQVRVPSVSLSFTGMATSAPLCSSVLFWRVAHKTRKILDPKRISELVQVSTFTRPLPKFYTQQMISGEDETN